MEGTTPATATTKKRSFTTPASMTNGSTSPSMPRASTSLAALASPGHSASTSPSSSSLCTPTSSTSSFTSVLPDHPSSAPSSASNLSDAHLNNDNSCKEDNTTSNNTGNTKRKKKEKKEKKRSRRERSAEATDKQSSSLSLPTGALSTSAEASAECNSLLSPRSGQRKKSSKGSSTIIMNVGSGSEGVMGGSMGGAGSGGGSGIEGATVKKVYANGSTYIGSLNAKGRRNGQGKMIFKDGQYEGSWKNGKQHGFGTYVWTSGSKYEGEWKEGKFHGQGTYTWPSGASYTGDWANGRKNGQGKFTWANGTKYEGQFLDDMKHGMGDYVSGTDGTKYFGEYKNDQMHGQGTYLFPDGARYVGEFRNNNFEGRGTYTTPDGTSYTGEFSEDQRHGVGLLKPPHLGCFKVRYVNGKIVEHQDMVGWLKENNCGKYAELFKKEDVTFDVLAEMTDKDLRDLGVVEFGKRRKLLNAIAQLPIKPRTASSSSSMKDSSSDTEELEDGADLIASSQGELYGDLGDSLVLEQPSDETDDSSSTPATPQVEHHQRYIHVNINTELVSQQQAGGGQRSRSASDSGSMAPVTSSGDDSSPKLTIRKSMSKKKKRGGSGTVVTSLIDIFDKATPKKKKEASKQSSTANTDGGGGPPGSIFKKKRSHGDDAFDLARRVEELALNMIPKYREIERSELKIEKRPVGRGVFGIVYRGEWRGATVAVKKLVGALGEKELTELFREAALLEKLCHHPHVVNYIGIVKSREDVSLVTQFYEKGSLYDILIVRREKVPWKTVVGMARDAAAGILHLHREKVIHRDVAARNCLVDESCRVVVTDFGLSRVKTSAYLQSNNNFGPVAWMAPESLLERQFSEKSDAYSFGVLLWELVARQSTPYPGESSPYNIALQVIDGMRPIIPEDCPKEFRELMQDCWKKNRDERPDFESLENRLAAYYFSLAEE
ncbi:Receptor-interacting serine/threonine-protein kinase 3 [Balamuthia mandrillaris]